MKSFRKRKRMSGMAIWGMVLAGVVAIVAATMVVSNFTGLDLHDVGEAILAAIAIPTIAISWLRWRREESRRIGRLLGD